MKQLLLLPPFSCLFLSQNLPNTEKTAIIIIDLEQSSVISQGIPVPVR